MDDQTDSPDDHHAVCLRTALRARGIPARYVAGSYSRHHRVPDRWLAFAIGGRNYLFARGALLLAGRDPWGRLGLHINDAANRLIHDKQLTKEFLAGLGFGVPAGRTFPRHGLDAALAAFPDFPGPVCVKPNQGTMGRLVFTAIRDAARYGAALGRVAAAYRTVLVEESVEGPVFRFFFVRPRVVAVKLSRPASVAGDGRSTIARLIEAKNDRRIRQPVPGHLPIVVDDDVREVLAMTGRGLEDVPAAGERVFLRATSNGATGADSIVCPGAIHPSYAAVVAAACNAVPGLAITAADVVVADPGAPAGPCNHWILEMNRNPGVTPYHFPWRGQPQDVAGAILDFLESDAGAAWPAMGSDRSGRPDAAWSDA